jgi:cell division transport system permease protein
MSRHEQDSPAIGIASIWGEGQGVDRVSLPAVVTHCVRQAYENIRRSAVTSILTLVTIAVAIFLLGVFFLGVHNSTLAVSRDGGEMEVMVFLKDGASASELQTFTKQLQELAPGRTVTYTDKGQALQAFRKSLGEDASMLDGLDADNPLPASLQIRLTSADEAEAVYGAVLERFKDVPRVESIRYSRGAVQQIKKMLRLVQVIGAVGMAFLFIIAGFIIANTIKLALYNHRTEVEIMQLVGARRAAICAPYLLEGLVQGLLGAAVGLLGVFTLFLLVRNFLHKAQFLEAIFPNFTFIPGGYIGGTLLAGAIVGVVGSFLAVRRFLAESQG